MHLEDSCFHAAFAIVLVQVVTVNFKILKIILHILHGTASDMNFFFEKIGYRSG